MFSYLNPFPSLPQYNGPHKVAVTDYEIPVSEISSNGTTVPDSDISTIKFRIYYPARQDEKSKESIYWVPSPQKQWNEAYASFLGANASWMSVVSKAWSVTNYAKLPVVGNGALMTPAKGDAHPVCIFSHGLGGNSNIYSSIVGSLASCGVVTVAPEHRDGSCPISFVKNAKGEVEKTIPYQKLSHSPDVKVLNARNAQLRIRLWELELTYAAVKAMNEGKKFTNYAHEKKHSALDLKGQLKLTPGSVTWAGHSFGAATITQFVKSIFYHQDLPQVSKSDDDQEWDWTPLYKTQSSSDLVKQITPESPVALLDIWTMPLRAKNTNWLWELPMPCYSRETSANSKPNTVAMISGEFYKYEGMLNRTRALLSKRPAQAIQIIESHTESKQQPLPPAVAPAQKDSSYGISIPELSKNESPSKKTDQPTAIPSLPSSDSSRTTSPSRSNLNTPDVPSPASSQSSLPLPDSDTTSKTSSVENSTLPQMYHIPQSAHLSQSDFGLLFPNLTKYAMKAVDPEKTIEMNVRAILAVMRNQGLKVEGLVERNGKREDEDYILDGEANEKPTEEIPGGVAEVARRKKEQERWVRVPLVAEV